MRPGAHSAGSLPPRGRLSWSMLTPSIPSRMAVSAWPQWIVPLRMCVVLLVPLAFLLTDMSEDALLARRDSCFAAVRAGISADSIAMFATLRTIFVFVYAFSSRLHKKFLSCSCKYFHMCNICACTIHFVGLQRSCPPYDPLFS